MLTRLHEPWDILLAVCRPPAEIGPIGLIRPIGPIFASRYRLLKTCSNICINSNLTMTTAASAWAR